MCSETIKVSSQKNFGINLALSTDHRYTSRTTIVGKRSLDVWSKWFWKSCNFPDYEKCIPTWRKCFGNARIDLTTFYQWVWSCWMDKRNFWKGEFKNNDFINKSYTSVRRRLPWRMPVHRDKNPTWEWPHRKRFVGKVLFPFTSSKCRHVYSRTRSQSVRAENVRIDWNIKYCRQYSRECKRLFELPVGKYEVSKMIIITKGNMESSVNLSLCQNLYADYESGLSPVRRYQPIRFTRSKIELSVNCVPILNMKRL